MNEAIFPISPLGGARQDKSAQDAAETSPGGAEPVRWVVVWQGPGLLPAQIVADRLRLEGIPANAWQEGAGRAIGLTVGLLGTGNVSVPETHEDAAREALAAEADEFDDELDHDEAADPD